MDQEEITYLKIHIEHLFSQHHQEDPSRDLLYISKYFLYLSNTIDYQKFIIGADIEFIDSFESVYLWLQEKLLIYPESIRRQVYEIYTTKKLCEIFAIISNLNEQHVREIRRNRFVRKLPKLYSFLGIKLMLPLSDNEIINSNKIFDAKMALKRLSQIIKYASSISVIDYDESINEFKDHYDPNIINKNKILTLINYLRVQIDQIPDEKTRIKISEKLESLEAEIKRPKVRWAVVFTGFFVLFGFVADLKTIDSDIYSKPLKTVEAIISLLHEDGKVQNSHPQLFLELPKETQGENLPARDAPNDKFDINLKEEEYNIEN